jgi:type I restriction enzyme S subunit
MDFNTFLENFDAIAEAPGGIPQLRSLILDLAVRGKLVSQNLEDESASKLLERLKGERKKLIEEKKFRKSDLVETANTKELFYEIPRSWEWTRIGSFALVKGGKRLPQGSSFSVQPTDYIYIRVTNMKDGTITQDGLKYIDEETYLKISQYTIEKDDLYISIAGTIGEVGEVPAFFHQMNLTENAAKIVFRGLDKHYFLLALQSNVIQDQFKEKTNKQAQPKLALKRIADTVIPIPPKDEQGRIVAKVNELMGLCDRYEATKQVRDSLRQKLRGSAITSLMNAGTDEELDAAWAIVRDNWCEVSQSSEDVSGLRQVVLQLAVQGKLVPQNSNDEPAELLRNRIIVEKQKLEKSRKISKQPSATPVQEAEQPYFIPNNWCWCRWNDVALYIGDIDHKMPTEVFEGIPYVSSRDFKKNNTIDFERAKKISYEDFERLKRKVQPTKGDIIFPRYGTIGENRLVEVDIDFLASYSCAIIKNFHGYIEPKYSYYYSLCKLVKSEIERYTNKTTQPNVGIQSIQNFIYPLPPLAEQKRIVAKVEELMKLCDQLEVSLRQSQQRAESLAASAISHLTI